MRVFLWLMVILTLTSHSLWADIQTNEDARKYIKVLQKKGQTQKQISLTLGVSVSTLSRFMNKATQTSPTILAAVKKQHKLIKVAQKAEEKMDAPQQIVPKAEVKKIKKKPFKAQRLRQAPISISYRNDGVGRGAFFDHYTVQKTTKHPTQILHHQGAKISQLKDHIEKGATFNLPSGKEMPASFEGAKTKGGLLIIPGAVRDQDTAEREEFENKLIRKARLKGQPILAICAGSWRLWEAYYGKTKSVSDHNYNSGMVRLSDQGYIIYNIQIHQVDIEETSLLAGARGKNATLTPHVNSVHWMAPSEDKVKLKDTAEKALNSLLSVSSRSVTDTTIQIKNRQGDIMKPTAESVESFETKAGSPVMGIQWHPETYFDYMGTNKTRMTDEGHMNILKYMALAGDAYRAKRNMLKEFKNNYKAK